ncbi:putative armadillo-like helical protein [Plasmopara halstedii]
MPGRAYLEPEEAEYPLVPTPKELELSQQLVELQKEKDHHETRALARICDLESQIHKYARIHDLALMLENTKRSQLLTQQAAVEEERMHWKAIVQNLQLDLDREKNDKEAQKKWHERFLSPVTVSQDIFAVSASKIQSPGNGLEKRVFAHFAQSLALLPASQAPYVVKAGILPFLVHLLQEQMGDVVIGSVLIAFVHLAIYGVKSQSCQHTSLSREIDVREQIVKAGVGAPLVEILEHSQNARILVEASRLCAALATFAPNKRALASKNVVRFLIQHLVPCILSRSQEMCDNDNEERSTVKLDTLSFPWDPNVQHSMLIALVNLSHGCENLRAQIAASPTFVSIVVHYLKQSPDVNVQIEAAKLLGNMAYNNAVNQSILMAADTATALSTCLTAVNLQRSSQLVRAGAIGLANLAYTSTNQLIIGNSDTSTLLLQLLVDAVKIPTVIEGASIALACLCHQNPSNKARVAAQNGLQVLLYALQATLNLAENDVEGSHDAALIALCESFAIIVHSRVNRQHATELDGHVILCNLCSSAKNLMLVKASAHAICAMVPPPNERNALIADNRESEMETKSITLETLERARYILKQEAQRVLVPNEDENTAMGGRLRWLTRTIDTLVSYRTPSVLSSQYMEGDNVAEFCDRSSLLLESFSSVLPDELCPQFFYDDQS